MALKKKEKILQSGTIQILKVKVILKEGRHVVKVVCLDPRIFFVIFRISLRLEVTHLINDLSDPCTNMIYLLTDSVRRKEILQSKF